jgi:rod shape determining protein RodA
VASATIPRRTPLATRSAAAPWRHIDVALLGAVLLLAGLGLLMVYSATRNRLGVSPTFFLERQALFTVAGLGVMAVTTLVDYRVFRDYAPLLYGASVVGLLLVLSPLGSNKKGAQAWFQLGPFQLQPSELAKVALIVCIAAYCAAFRGDLDARRMVTVLALAAVPMALIEAQPDLGTVMVFAAILLATLLVAGVKPRHMAVLAVIGVVGLVAVFQLGLLKQYQLDRLGAFLNQGGTPADASSLSQPRYHLNQSKIAIANGGVLGKGLFHGTQTKLAYVPEQHTDFIFTVVGEELGLVGSAFVLLLFGLVVWRTWRAAALAKDVYGTILCVGVLGMLVFQIFENVGMTMGIMPIVGIPLPFMSYGGSAALATFAATGLVLNVHMRRFS